MHLGTDEIKAMSRDFSGGGGGKAIKSADKRSRGRAFSILTAQMKKFLS